MAALHVERIAGPAGAAELVLLHGWGSDASIWAGLLPELRQHFSLTLMDLPGHGQSPELAADISAWCEAVLALAPCRAVWLGWSLGGTLALAVAARAPARVQALLLLACNPRFLQGPDWPAAMAPAEFAAFRARVVADPEAALSRFHALQTRGLAEGRQLRQTLWDAGQGRASLAGLNVLAAADLRAEFAQLAVPTLLLLGEEDALVPAALAGQLPVRPGIAVHVLSGGGHVPFLSRPRSCLTALLAFCRQPEAAA